MKLFSITALAVFLSFSSVVSAQLVADLSIPHTVYNPVENTMCVPVIANRYQEVVSHLFALRFDPSQLAYSSVRSINEEFPIDHSVYHNPMPGMLRCFYYQPDTTITITLPDTTVLFEVCFTPRIPDGYSFVAFDSTYSNIFLSDNGQHIAPESLVDGSITFGGMSPLPLLPGDTNADGTVDHTDLLNIGLAYGATGPARTTPVDDFTVIEAQPWPQSLPDDTNFANIDADGNSTIEAADVAILTNFYGQEVPGLWNPGNGTTTGRSANPALYLGGLDTINAGELVTLPIFLGGEDNAAAGGNGLAFTLQFNPGEVDASSLTINLENSFLGNDLLSIATVTELETGRFEVALTRKDRADAPVPTGPALVGHLSFRALNNTANENYQLNLLLTPDAYLSADQSAIALGGTGNDMEVNGTVSSENLTLARGITIYPNPTKEGIVMLNNVPAGVTEINLYTMQGQELVRYPVDQRTLDLNGLPSGVYVVRIVAGGEQVIRLVRKVR